MNESLFTVFCHFLPPSSSWNWASSIELLPWNFAYGFLLTLYRTKHFYFFNYLIFRRFPIFFLLWHSSPRFSITSSWPSFLKFCIRLPNNILQNLIFFFNIFKHFLLFLPYYIHKYFCVHPIMFTTNSHNVSQYKYK